MFGKLTLDALKHGPLETGPQSLWDYQHYHL